MKDVVLDTETTGLFVKDGHRIVEIGCIELDELVPTKNKFHCYLNPERKVSEKALEVHGYTDQFLSTQKKFSEIVDEFLNFIENKRLIIHNAEFDLSHLNNELALLGKRKINNGGKYVSVNVGTESWNYQVKKLAEAVCDNIPNTTLAINADAQPDKRSYKVDFSLFKVLAPDYQPIMSLDQSIKEIYEGLQDINFQDTQFRKSKYMRLNSLNYLIENNVLDTNLNWID